MTEYIRRGDALKILKGAWSQLPGDDAMQEAIDSITHLSAADVIARKHGWWIGFPECLKYTNAYSDDHIVCSACEECFSILNNDCERFNFCPNCGADMRETNDEKA